MNNNRFSSIFWDFGGVITSSPFEAFNAFEKENNIPFDFIRKVNSTNPFNNAWAQLEQSKICLLYTSPSPRDATLSRMPSSA